MTRTIAITGATGFIGGALVQRLSALGWKVRALVRSEAGRKQLNEKNIECVVGDLEDLKSLRELITGVDAIVHCAGAVRGAAQNDFDRVNSVGVARLVRVVAEQSVMPYFVLISSLAAREPQLSYYASSKLKGEKMLEAHAGSMDWDIVRPPAVYGPGDKEMLPLFQWMFRGLAPLIGSDANRVSLIHVEDLVDAIVCLLGNKKQNQQQIYELHDGHQDGYSWEDIIHVVEALCGRSIYTIKIPISLVRLTGFINVQRANIFGGMPMLTPGKVRELNHPNWVADNSPLHRDTGWKPKVTLAEGLRQLFELSGER